MKKYILFYGLLGFAILMLFQLSSLWIFRQRASTEWLLIVVATVSIAIGIWYARGEKQKKANNPPTPDLEKIKALGITERELEVLQLIDQGYSNKEVGEKLFISENTVKTHVSNLLTKLDARRRTQALTNAKELKIIV